LYNGAQADSLTLLRVDQDGIYIPEYLSADADAVLMFADDSAG